MKLALSFYAIIIIFMLTSCKNEKEINGMKIVFLHHSTGEIIWNGKAASLFERATRKISNKLGDISSQAAELPKLFEKYNKEFKKNYLIIEKEFPKETPYGWSNFPYDYYNIWVKNAGEKPFMEEPTLELLTKEYQVIVFKHCFPVCYIQPDLDSADINSGIKTLSNYKLQYLALRNKMLEFPETKFILFTGAAQVKQNISEDKAKKAKEFFNWVLNEWDLPNDNIYIWDLYSLQTEGDLYLKEEYAASANNSHPNSKFAGIAVKLLFNRIVDVIENNGNKTTITGKRN